MRLFVALDIDAAIRDRITAFRDRMRRLAPGVRWVGPETFHVTLQFLGEASKLDEIVQALQAVNSSPVQLSFRRASFFPNPKSPRVFWVGIDADAHLQELVTAVSQVLTPLGFARDPGPFTPHLTLARSGSGSPKPVHGERPAPALLRVAVELATSPPPDFGTMTAHQFYLYESHLSPAGPRYEKRATFALRMPPTTNHESL
jgi:RNA 2',3'-cyclic 3'-phosphodiesterase